MPFTKWFIKLMKSEPTPKVPKFLWAIDERKCLNINEIKTLRTFCANARRQGVRHGKFSPVRNWFMIELGLNAGLRVAEMASLKHSDLIIDDERSSIVVIGKGNKKRAVWINADFKRKCQLYLSYKKRFVSSLEENSYLLNNLKGGKISKRALQKFFKTIMKEARLPDHFHIHCLRHTYTTFLLSSSNFNYRFVQQQLGHSSINTTQVYAGIIESEGKKAVEKRADERRVREADFPVIKTMDTYDFKVQPYVNERLIRELMRGEYIDKKENVLLIGNPGTGKTHLACALAFAACSQGRRVSFYTVTKLVTELLECREERRLQRLQKQLQRLQVLVLDELGYVPFTETGTELLFEVTSYAYERHSLIVTSNLPFGNWTEIFGSERLTGALLDRLTHRCHILEANGESYRLRQAKKQTKPRANKKSHSEAD